MSKCEGRNRCEEIDLLEKLGKERNSQPIEDWLFKALKTDLKKGLDE